MPFDNGVDLLCRLLHLSGKSFRLTGRDSHLGHLGSGSIGLKLICLSSLIFAAKETRRNRAEKLLQDAIIGVGAILHCAFKILNFGLGSLVGKLAHDRVQEVDATKGTCDNGIDGVLGSLETDLSLSTNVRKDISLAKFDQSQFGVVAVSRVV